MRRHRRTAGVSVRPRHQDVQRLVADRSQRCGSPESAVLVVAGLSVKNFEPRVWDPASPYHIPALTAVMVSYAEFHQLPARRRLAMRDGLRAYLGVPDRVSVYLDNGAFYFGSQ